jgi:hypothetical protein
MLSAEEAAVQFAEAAEQHGKYFELRRGRNGNGGYLRVRLTTRVASPVCTCSCWGGEGQQAALQLLRDATCGADDSTVDDADRDEQGESLGVQARGEQKQKQKGPVHLYSYDVCYDPVYRVPVLCFVVMHLDPGGGEAVVVTDLDVVLGDLGRGSSGRVQEGKGFEQDWTFVGQAEHPVTNSICWVLHPCNTKAAMLAMQPSSPSGYLLLWFSLMAPLVKCEKMPATATATAPVNDDQ